MLETLLAILAGAYVVIQIEKLRKPRLDLRLLPPHSAEYPRDRPAKRGHVVTLAVYNRLLPWWAKWMCRNAAQQCRGQISFHHLDGQSVFGRVMIAKWVRTTEGAPLPIIDLTAKVSGYLIDPERIMREPRIDIAPGESAALDVAVRFDDEPECYGWNMDSYRPEAPWRNPTWKLSPGRYLVHVKVFAGDQGCTGLFRLINDVPVDAFRLEPTQRGDRVVG